MAGAIDVHGLKDFQRDLRRVDPRLAKTLQRAHKVISGRVVDRIKPAVTGLAAPGSHRIGRGITPRATQTRAKIAFSGANRTKPLFSHILGAEWHPVYGRFVPTREMRRPLWQAHLGARWHWTQLYGAGPAIRKQADTFVLDEYADAVMDAMSEAFPERG